MTYKKVIIAIFLSILFCTSGYCATKKQTLDSIVAVVNDDIVTHTELDHALSIAKMQISQDNLSMPSENVLQKQVLDQLINKKLQLQVAKQSGIKVTSEDLDKAIHDIASRNNMTTESLYDRLSHDGMSKKDYRTEMRDQMILNKLQQQELVGHITVSPEELKSFMHSRLWQSNGSKEYKVEDIIIPLNDAPSPDEIVKARKKAEAVMTQLKSGKSFRQLAQTESSGTQALSGGNLGWRKLPEIPSAFADQVANMQVKDIAGPIQTANGFHLIRLSAMRNVESQENNLSQKQIENLLMQRKFEEAMQNWISKLRSQAYVVLKL